MKSPLPTAPLPRLATSGIPRMGMGNLVARSGAARAWVIKGAVRCAQAGTYNHRREAEGITARGASAPRQIEDKRA